MYLIKIRFEDESKLKERYTLYTSSNEEALKEELDKMQLNDMRIKQFEIIQLQEDDVSAIDQLCLNCGSTNIENVSAILSSKNKKVVEGDNFKERLQYVLRTYVDSSNEKEIAKKVGVSRSTLKIWQSGKSVPSIIYLARLAHVLDIPMSEFFTDADLTMPEEDDNGGSELIQELTGSSTAGTKSRSKQKPGIGRLDLIFEDESEDPSSDVTKVDGLPF